MENEGIYFTEDALKRYFVHYERRIKEKFNVPDYNEQITFRDLFKKQIVKIGKSILENENYKPFKISE